VADFPDGARLAGATPEGAGRASAARDGDGDGREGGGDGGGGGREGGGSGREGGGGGAGGEGASSAADVDPWSSAPVDEGRPVLDSAVRDASSPQVPATSPEIRAAGLAAWSMAHGFATLWLSGAFPAEVARMLFVELHPTAGPRTAR
jgi:hypothetical protein